jgi:hypothetical protein
MMAITDFFAISVMIDIQISRERFNGTIWGVNQKINTLPLPVCKPLKASDFSFLAVI